MSSKQTFVLYVRTFIFGVEDSLVSTVGLLSGVALSGADRNAILLSGFILIFVEAFSMGVGSLLSEHQAESYLARRSVPIGHAATSGALMFVSYLIAGLIPLAPYLYYTNSVAISLSIALTLLALFVLGMVSAFFFKISLLRNGFEMLIMGGLAILVGILVGHFVGGGLLTAVG